MCRAVLLSLCIATVALAEAWVHPLIALLHSLICNIWSTHCAQHRHAAQPTTRQEGDSGQSSRQQLLLSSLHCCCCEHTGKQLLQKDVQHQQNHNRQQLSDHRPPAGLTLHQQTPSITNLLDTESGLHQQQCKHEVPHHLMHQEQSATLLALQQPQKTPDESEQLLPAPPEQFHTLMLHGSRAWHAATWADAQMMYLKMGICAIVLSALPCVAWLKQPRHMRQSACWQDALPAAVVAVHASISTFLVRS